jgi:alpha,alpha-trehalose phosphorylase
MLNASESMFLPYDADLDINSQDDSFLQKPVWPFKESKYPLLLNYHPLTIYRYQVNKQPDTVLSHFLLEEYTNEDIMRNSYYYYEKLSTHDSSLSACIHGIMAARIGAVNRAYDYFEQTVSLDLENTHGNTKDGLHMANIGGAALMVISGFGGFRINEKGVTLRPQLPARWKGYEFKIQYRNREIKVSVSDKLTVNLLSGEPLQIAIWDKTYLLSDSLNQPLYTANKKIGTK